MGSSPDEEAAIRRARHVLGAAKAYDRAEVSFLRGRRDFLMLVLLVAGLYASIALPFTTSSRTWSPWWR